VGNLLGSNLFDYDLGHRGVKSNEQGADERVCVAVVGKVGGIAFFAPFWLYAYSQKGEGA
jgi:hypothetical protein